MITVVESNIIECGLYKVWGGGGVGEHSDDKNILAVEMKIYR